MNREHDSNIGVKSRIRLDVVVSGLILMAAITIQWANLRAEISTIARDQWTTKDQLQWSLQLKTLNPTLNVPMPDPPNAFANLSRNNNTNAAVVGAIVKGNP